MQGIQNIIFDLGGVLLDIDYQKTETAFEKLGFPDFKQAFSQLRQNAFFDDWETGALSADEWFSGIKSHVPYALTDDQITDAWNDMLLDFPIARLRLLQQLRSRYNLFLLSNTNEIHERAFNKLLQEQTGFPSLAVLFDKVYYSHRIGLRKPNPEPFRLILTENHLKAEETLFIDDSPQHIEAAKALGIQTIHLVPPKTIEDIFRPVGAPN